MITHLVLAISGEKGVLIPSEDISCIDFFFHVIQAFVISIRNDCMATLLEIIKIIDYQTAKESGTIFECWLIDNDLCSLCFNAFHDSLD